MGADTVADLLREQGFSLQGNARTIEGRQHPDRDGQFRYISGQAKAHQDAGEPVISVDTKKKELVGEFRNAGREWRPAGRPAAVKDHDFADPQLGKVIPYGIYDLAANAGWVKSAPTTTPPRSPSSRSAAGGTAPAATATRPPGGC